MVICIPWQAFKCMLFDSPYCSGAVFRCAQHQSGVMDYVKLYTMYKNMYICGLSVFKFTFSLMFTGTGDGHYISAQFLLLLLTDVICQCVSE